MSLRRIVLSLILFAGGSSTSWCALAQPGAVLSERGAVAVTDTTAPALQRWQRDTPPPPRGWATQPPTIPHSIKGYNITRNFNKCVDCHARARHRETGATKIPESHYVTREGEELATVAPLRYFCYQCHAPQVEARPLAANVFKPAEGYRPQSGQPR